MYFTNKQSASSLAWVGCLLRVSDKQSLCTDGRFPFLISWRCCLVCYYLLLYYYQVHFLPGTRGRFISQRDFRLIDWRTTSPARKISLIKLRMDWRINTALSRTLRSVIVCTIYGFIMMMIMLLPVLAYEIKKRRTINVDWIHLGGCLVLKS